MDSGGTSDDRALCGTCPVRVLNALGRLPAQVINSLVLILGTGLVLSILELIYLSFMYPGRLGSIVGVITPLITVSWQGYKLIKQRKRIGTSNGSSDDDTDIRPVISGK